MDEKEMQLKSPRLFAGLALVGALMGVFITVEAAQTGQTSAAIFFFVGSLVLFAGVRLAASPRLKITPDALVYPRGWITMKPLRVAWTDVQKAEFQLVSGFAWPMLILDVRGRDKPLEIPFPLVNLDRRKEALDLIQHYVAQAQAKSPVAP